jgi:ankyrin repeat protein
MGSLHMLQCLHLNKQLSFEPDNSNSTPLHLAASRGSVDCVQVLLSAGHPTVVTDSHGCSPLHVACMEQHLTVVNILAQIGHIDEYDSTGASPLMVCVAKGMDDAIKTLLKHGARASHRDYTGRSCMHALLSLPQDTPEQLALQQSIAMMLIQHGIDVNSRDTVGRTPCHVASEKGNIEMLKLLIDHGGDVSVADAAGKTCMAQLNREHFQVVTSILIDRIIPLSHRQASAIRVLCINVQQRAASKL